MADTKTYLNVPFAEKDAAKALGARWDAANKKWYVPPKKDIALFAQWRTQSGTMEPASTTGPRPSSPKKSALSAHAGAGVITHPADKNFVAYDGDEPPWD